MSFIKHSLLKACVLASLVSACAAPPKEMTNGSLKQTVSYWPSILNWIRPYQPAVPQGVFVTKEMVSQLKGGMTQVQVRFVLGSPLIQDPFHKDRWDYPFRYDNGLGKVTSSNLSVFFNAQNKLVSLQGGKFPTEAEFIQLIGATQ